MSICYWTVCHRTIQWANNFQGCNLYQPITFILIAVNVRATLNNLRLLSQSFNAN